MLLKLVAGTWPPFSGVTSMRINGKNITLLDQESLMGKMINVLANQFNFSYEIANQDVNIGWGNQDSSVDELRFNEMVGMIQRNEVDLGVGPFSVSRGFRYLVSNPSTMIMQDEFLFLSSGRNVIADQTHLFSSLLKSFEIWVWILFLIALICVSIIRSVADLLLNENKKKKLIKMIEDNLMFHHRNMTRQNIKMTANKFCSHKMIDISWLLPSFLLSLFYSSMILAQLLASSERPIDSLNDLANAEHVMIIVDKNSNLKLIIKEGKSDDVKRIYSRVKNKFGEENCFVTASEKISDYSMSQILAGKRVLFGSIIPLKNLLSDRYKQGKSCGFHIGSTIQDDGLCMLFNKRFDGTLKRKIDKKLLDIFECKPFDFLINKGIDLYSFCLEQNHNINHETKSLSISNIHGLFLVCMIMIGLAHIILICEKSAFHLNLFFSRHDYPD